MASSARPRFCRVKIFRVDIGPFSITELGKAQRFAGFPALGLFGFMLKDWVIFVLRLSGEECISLTLV